MKQKLLDVQDTWSTPGHLSTSALELNSPIVNIISVPGRIVVLQVMLKFLQVFFGQPMFDFSSFHNTLQLLLFCLLLFIAYVPLLSLATVLMYSHFLSTCLPFFKSLLLLQVWYVSRGKRGISYVALYCFLESLGVYVPIESLNQSNNRL